MALWDTLISPLIGQISTIVGQFHLSPEQQKEYDEKMAAVQQAAQQQANDYEVQLNSIAGQNIRTEESSGDKFTVRARPAVIWMGNVLIFWNYGIVPVFGFHWHLTPVTFPDAFWWTWGTVVTGYVFSRTMEKISSLPGDSQIQLPFGLGKVGNKS